MKKLLASLVCLSLSCLLVLGQAKRVYVTLDVSSSMNGNKYVLANYTSQMIVTLCDEDDEVNMIVYGVNNCLSNENDPLKAIQKPIGDIKFGNPSSSISQFDDIVGFNRVYNPSNGKQDWLFIIGDGYWSTQSPAYAKDKKKFKNTVEAGSLNVCYLQTCLLLSEHSDFTQFADSLGVVDIAKSDQTSATIKQGCDHFARKILGFSDVPLRVTKKGTKCIGLKTELPLSSFYLVYQDEVLPNALPRIESVTSDDVTFQVKHKGTPTSTPVKSLPDDIDLSGNVWLVKADSPIQAGDEVTVCFDQGIGPSAISIYPLVKEVEFGSVGMTTAGGTLKRIDSRTFCIKSTENSAVVRIELNESSRENLPEALLKKTKVVVKANNKEYRATYRDGGFDCRIELEGNETQYYAECDCPGYFKRVTSLATIVKGDCDPEPVGASELPTKELPPLEFDPMTIEALRNEPMRFYIHNIGETAALDPNKFDISVDVENSFLYDDPAITFEEEIIALNIRPKGKWCDCFFPDEIKFTIVSTPKEGAFEEEGIQYNRIVSPGRVPVVKDEPWLSRCLWVLITMGCLLLFILYLRALIKKNRFHKFARMKNLYYDDDSPKEKEKEGRPMRAPGLGPWLDRWLNPFHDESITMSFNRPKTKNLTFVASSSKNKVFLKESCFDPRTMVVPNYVPKPKAKKEKEGEPIPINTGTKMEIKKLEGTSAVRAGHLKYVIRDKDDEPGFRTFIGLLMALSVICFIALVILVIRGL